MKSDAQNLAGLVLQYFSEKSNKTKWEEDYIKDLAYRIKQQEEMREWNL